MRRTASDKQAKLAEQRELPSGQAVVSVASQADNVEPSEPLVLAAYNTAFQRLNFQDDYLIKICTLFLTVQGALITFAGAALLQLKTDHVVAYVALIITSLLGAFTCTVWEVWIEHNDVWHVINVGILRKIENDHFAPTVRVFSADGKALAASHPDGEFAVRKRGHEVAHWLPTWLRVAWACATVATSCAWLFPLASKWFH